MFGSREIWVSQHVVTNMYLEGRDLIRISTFCIFSIPEFPVCAHCKGRYVELKGKIFSRSLNGFLCREMLQNRERFGSNSYKFTSAFLKRHFNGQFV